MRMILAIIQPTKLSAVREALAKIGVTRMTVCDAQGYARQRGLSLEQSQHSPQSQQHSDLPVSTPSIPPLFHVSVASQ